MYEAIDFLNVTDCKESKYHLITQFHQIITEIPLGEDKLESSNNYFSTWKDQILSNPPAIG